MDPDKGHTNYVEMRPVDESLPGSWVVPDGQTDENYFICQSPKIPLSQTIRDSTGNEEGKRTNMFHILYYVLNNIECILWRLIQFIFFVLFSGSVEPETLEIQGSMRLLSDDFTTDLLNPETDVYQEKEQKYSYMVMFV